jgi:hypothetical protein
MGVDRFRGCVRWIVVAMTMLAACRSPAADTVSLSPATGDLRAGVEVRLEGAGFLDRGRFVVYFGGRAAKAVVVESARLIRARAPIPDAEASVPVTIHFEDGTVLAATPPFVYTAPAGIKVMPSALGPEIVESN